MLLHVATCYYMLSHVTTCYYRLLHVITSYYMNMLLTDIKCNLLLSTDQQMAKPFPLDTRREPETMMWYRNVLNLFTSQGLLGKWATPFQSISSQGCPDIVLPCFTQPNPPFLLGQASITTYEPLHIPRGKVWHVALLDRWPSHAGMHPFGSDSHTAPPGLNLNNQASFVQDSCKHVWKKMKITKITYVDQSRLSTVIYSGHYFKMLATFSHCFIPACDGFWLHTSLPANFQTATRPSRPNMFKYGHNNSTAVTLPARRKPCPLSWSHHLDHTILKTHSHTRMMCFAVRAAAGIYVWGRELWRAFQSGPSTCSQPRLGL